MTGTARQDRTRAGMARGRRTGLAVAACGLALAGLATVTSRPALAASSPAQTARFPAQTARVPAQTARVPAQTASVPAQAASIPAQTASFRAQTARSTAPAAGSGWRVQQVPPIDTADPDAQFSAVSCATSRSCLAVGKYVGLDGLQRTFAEHWDGSAWHIDRPASPPHRAASSLDFVSCASPTACQAIGHAGGSGVRSGTLIAEDWNGTSWRMVPVQQPGRTFVREVSCAAVSSCVLVGYRLAPGDVSQAVAEHWDGQRWSVSGPQRPLRFTQLNGVSCPGPRSCYAAGWASRSSARHPLVEHWNGSGWRVQPVAQPVRATRQAALAAVSCPTETSCTAVGSTGPDPLGRLLVEDLRGGRWTGRQLAMPRAAQSVEAGFSGISCSAARVCTALISYLNLSEELTWATASRGAAGGFRVAVPGTDVSADSLGGISCLPGACTIVGGLDTLDGQGDTVGGGTTFAWRGAGGHFVPQHTLNPPGSTTAALDSVSCAGQGFCAATTTSGQEFSVRHGQPPLLVRTSASGPWTIPAAAGPGYLSSVSCSSASFCLALGSRPGAERWDGHSWSQVPAPDRWDPGVGGLQTVSCTSPAFCLAVGSTKHGASARALAASWNGTTWTVLHPPAPAGSTQSLLEGVSCTSAAHCTADGYYTPGRRARVRALIETWTGAGWVVTRPRVPISVDSETGISISCAAPSACMAVWGGDSAAAAQWWNGARWVAAAFAGPPGAARNRSIRWVSCPSRTSCTAVGRAPAGPVVENWDGHRWRVTPSPQPAFGTGSFRSVSCTSPARCTTVGGDLRLDEIPLAEARGA